MKIKRILAAVLAAAMINAGNVTAVAAADIKRTEYGDSRPAFGQKYEDRVGELLETGVISQSTYDKIKAFLDENMQQPTTRPERWNTLEKLLHAGIISQTEYDSLKAALAAPAKRAEGQSKPDQSNPFSRFVTEGIISEETATAIMEYLTVNRTQKTERVDILSKMLESGVITQEEYDDIKASKPERSSRVSALAS